MKKLFVMLMLLFSAGMIGGLPQAASMLGVSSYAATKVVDAIMAGLSVWSIIALVATSAGSMAVVMATVKVLIKKVGRKAAIAW